MKNVLKKYDVKLIVRGPVFVGDGKEIGKKEYIFLSGRQVGVVDFTKLYMLARKYGKDKSLEKYMLEEWMNLEVWLKKEKLYDEVQKHCLKYILGMGDTQLAKGSKTQIMSCIKDHEGNPYLPGSTLKGLLRTVLGVEGLKGEMTKNIASKTVREADDSTRRRVNRKSFLRNASMETEGLVFRKLARPKTRPSDAVNDILSGLIVSDSEPIPISKLVLAQKVEKGVSGEEKTLNLLREAIMPGTEVMFTITVDSSICPFDKESILEAIAGFASAYNKCFLSTFSDAAPLKGNQVLVGGGTGFVSKTLVYPLLGKEQGVETTAKIIDATLPQNLKSRHKHYQDKRLGVSPHIMKCTWYGGRTVQMGLCDVEFC